MSRVALDIIVFDAGTQIRQSINDDVVTEYAERMSEGVVFPPVTLVHDGNRYYMADGFHRGLAAKRNDFKDIPADVRPGTKTDALWFALGANKANGQRLTNADKRHAICMAFQAWPERSAGELAKQLGVHQTYVSRLRDEVKTSLDLPSHVTGKDGKSYPASHRQPERKVPQEGRDGRRLDRSPDAKRARRDQMRTMAAEGYSSRQIAARLGLSEAGCRAILKETDIDVPGDRVTRGVHRHNATRIVETMVMDAEHLTADVNLIEFDTLDGAQLAAWIQSLRASYKALDAFIRRLVKEQQKHGEAA